MLVYQALVKAYLLELPDDAREFRLSGQVMRDRYAFLFIAAGNREGQHKLKSLAINQE